MKCLIIDHNKGIWSKTWNLLFVPLPINMQEIVSALDKYNHLGAFIVINVWSRLNTILVLSLSQKVVLCFRSTLYIYWLKYMKICLAPEYSLILGKFIHSMCYKKTVRIFSWELRQYQNWAPPKILRKNIKSACRNSSGPHMCCVPAWVPTMWWPTCQYVIVVGCLAVCEGPFQPPTGPSNVVAYQTHPCGSMQPTMWCTELYMYPALSGQEAEI